MSNCYYVKKSFYNCKNKDKMNQPETITNFQHIYITVDGEMALIVFSSCEKVGTIWTEDKDMIKAYTKDPKVKVFQHKYTPREKS